MPEVYAEPDLELFANALETMAFISPAPAAPPLMIPPRCHVATITFRGGPGTGAVEIAASIDFGAYVASNQLGCDVADEQAVTYAGDAIKELLNVFAGGTLDQLAARDGVTYEMSTPSIAPLEDATAWERLLAESPECCCDADGHLVMVRLREPA